MDLIISSSVQQVLNANPSFVAFCVCAPFFAKRDHCLRSRCVQFMIEVFFQLREGMLKVAQILVTARAAALMVGRAWFAVLTGHDGRMGGGLGERD